MRATVDLETRASLGAPRASTSAAAVRKMRFIGSVSSLSGLERTQRYGLPNDVRALASPSLLFSTNLLIFVAIWTRRSRSLGSKSAAQPRTAQAEQTQRKAASLTGSAGFIVRQRWQGESDTESGACDRFPAATFCQWRKARIRLFGRRGAARRRVGSRVSVSFGGGAVFYRVAASRAGRAPRL